MWLQASCQQQQKPPELATSQCSDQPQCDRHHLELCTHLSRSDEAEADEAGSAQSEKRQEMIADLAVGLELGCGHQPRRGRVPCPCN